MTPTFLSVSDAPTTPGVSKSDPRTALVQTVDFFHAHRRRSYSFGQIAATNALSDVYAMGGRP